ncbi:MAG: flavodoxin-dependent (E)-4-hydroxy-3-methylbut-2-enyl-diphosphate synthase [Clostridia bacterium]|nr:flavodoxin-dependent (E)-4-hydroxy-3-methylbut-2-enyl-diphosphate synthase [Clostridia bacterium]
MYLMSRVVKIGKIAIGGGNKIAVQSMTNTPTLDWAKTLEQLRQLKEVGCDIARIAVSSDQEVEACKNLIGKVDMPLVADIQFDYTHAIKCAEIGFDKIRFNPGYVDGDAKIKAVVDACKANEVPIRVGVNSGSLDKEIIAKFGSNATALGESALKHVAILEKFGFYDSVISVKSSSVKTMVDAYKYVHDKCDYPLHLGVTEGGGYERGIIKSSAGIGALLLSGMGDTIRVSLSAHPCKEIKAGKLLLNSVGLDDEQIQIVSCPTCSRCNYDLIDLVEKIEEEFSGYPKKIKLAVMGCAVNGPGEAKDADIAICGKPDGSLALFINGKMVKTINYDDALAQLSQLIREK